MSVDPRIDFTQLKNLPPALTAWAAAPAVGASYTLNGLPAISAGTNIITGNATPPGILVGTKLYLSAGTGTPEVVSVTGVSANSIAFTNANPHSGSWTITSATCGIQEVINANPGASVLIPKGVFNMQAPLTLDPLHGMTLKGMGNDRSGTNNGTCLVFATIGDGVHAINISNSSNLNPFIFEDFGIFGSGTTGTGDGFHLQNIVRVRISNVFINGFRAGIWGDQAFEITVDRETDIQFCANWGIFLQEIANLIKIRDCYINFNGRLNGALCGGIFISGSVTFQNTAILLQNVDIEENGTAPFTTVTNVVQLYIDCSYGVTVMNCYIEAPIGAPGNTMVFYGQNFNVVGLTEFGNWFFGGQVVYTATVTAVKSFNNTFLGTNTYRIFQNTDLSTYDIGPDNSLNSSPESANHPRLLALGSTAGSGNAALGPANCPAVTPGNINRWLPMIGSDGALIYVPAWK